MSWLFWSLCGAALGWWAEVVFGPGHPRADRVPDEPQPRDAATDRSVFAFVLDVLDALLVAPRRDGEGPAEPARRAQADPPEQATPARPASDGQIPWLVALLALLGLAAGQYFDAFDLKFYALQGFLLSPRVVALATSGLVGFWISRYRAGIAARLHDFYEALLGSETKSSWALQSVVAILLLFGIVLALKPDLLEHLESFKAGEVEAKFANVSESTREAVQISFVDEITRRVTIRQWVDFRKNYLDGSARDTALQFDQSAVKDERKAIRNVLFINYIEPLATLLTCLESDRRLDRLRRKDDFIAAVISLRNSILRVQQGAAGVPPTLDQWHELVRLLDRQIASAAEIVGQEVHQDVKKKEDCKGLEDVFVDRMESAFAFRDRADAIQLLEQGRQAVAKLQQAESEKRYKLSFIDPYFIGAVGDLIALALGHAEKANFLMEAKKGYPADVDLIQPGLINLYYQITDAQLKSEGPWPLDGKIDDLDWANDGANFVIRKSRQQIDRKQYDPVITVYLLNRLAFATRYLELYDQRVLGGGTMPEAHKVRWQRAYREVERVLALDGPGGTVPLDEVGPSPMRAMETAEWQRVELPLEIKYDARVAMALSTILLTERNRTAPAQACAMADVYLRGAMSMVPALKAELELYDGEAARLGAYLRQIGARVRISCPRRAD